MKNIKTCLLIACCTTIYLCQGMDNSAKNTTKLVVTTGAVMKPLSPSNIEQFIGKEILYRKNYSTYKRVMLGAKEGDSYWVFPRDANGFYSGNKGKLSLIGVLYEPCDN